MDANKLLRLGEHSKKRLPAVIRKTKRAIKWYKPVVIPKAAKTLFGGVQMDMREQGSNEAVKSPIMNKVGSIFVPVKDIEKSRDWYCKLLGLPNDCEIMNGHLCPLPMQGTGVILDTMPMWGGKEPGGAPPIKTPAFMLLTGDLQASYDFAVANKVNMVTDIQDDHWFVIKDPDDNLLMVCRE